MGVGGGGWGDMSAIPSDDLAGEQESMSSLPTLPQTKIIYVSPTMENAYTTHFLYSCR